MYIYRHISLCVYICIHYVCMYDMYMYIHTSMCMYIYMHHVYV